jgi:hypothetical protein
VTQEWKEQASRATGDARLYPKERSGGSLRARHTRYINLNSPEQLINALLAQGIPVPRDDVSGNYTTAKFKMNALAIEYPIINYPAKVQGLGEATVVLRSLLARPD